MVHVTLRRFGCAGRGSTGASVTDVEPSGINGGKSADLVEGISNLGITVRMSEPEEGDVAEAEADRTVPGREDAPPTTDGFPRGKADTQLVTTGETSGRVPDFTTEIVDLGGGENTGRGFV